MDKKEIIIELLKWRNKHSNCSNPKSSGTILKKEVEEALIHPITYKASFTLLLEGSCPIYLSLRENKRCGRFKANCVKCLFHYVELSDTEGARVSVEGDGNEI